MSYDVRFGVKVEGMNVIEKVLKAVAACPNCQFCPYEDYSTRYCGNCKERRRKDAETAKRLMEAIRRTEG